MNKLEMSDEKVIQLEEFANNFKMYILLYPEELKGILKEVINEDRLLMGVKTEFTTKEAAAYLRIKPKTLDNKLSNGEKIPYKLYGKFRKFIKEDLDAYIEANTKPGNFFVV